MPGCCGDRDREIKQVVLELDYKRVNVNAARGSKIIVASSSELLIELIQVNSQIPKRKTCLRDKQNIP